MLVRCHNGSPATDAAVIMCFTAPMVLAAAALVPHCRINPGEFMGSPQRFGESTTVSR